MYYVLCIMFYVLRVMYNVLSFMLYVICFVCYALCLMFYVLCFMCCILCIMLSDMTITMLSGVMVMTVTTRNKQITQTIYSLKHETSPLINIVTCNIYQLKDKCRLM